MNLKGSVVRSSAICRKILVRRMWEGGPLQQFASRPLGGNWMWYSNPLLTGYVGSYVCDRCQEPTVGVYRQHNGAEWVCGGCRKMRYS